MPAVKPPYENFARIKVVGVGGSGGNAVSYMVSSKVRNVEFVAINTDAQDLHHALAPTKVRIGKELTRGLGAGMNPGLGRQAAEESRDEIAEVLKGADLVVVTGGLGGGTCSGAAPVIAEVAKKLGALTVGVVTLPFSFEGRQRGRIADEAWQELRKNVDSLVTIENDRILATIERDVSVLNAFKSANDVLRHAVSGIADIITVPGLVNVDFADMRAIMADSGIAILGLGKSIGEGKAAQAAKAAIASPLIDASIQGAKGLLFTVSGSKSLAMHEVHEVAKVITEQADPEAKIIFGAVVDRALRKNEVRVTLIATGLSDRRAAEALFVGMNEQREAGRPQEVFVQRRRTYTDAVTPPDSGQSGAEGHDPFEIPAFIRRKLNRE